MPIQSEDIKLLKSAVMTDEADGGGAMTGDVVVDGASNNLFPDVSEMDLAFGRVNVRLVYGVAHTDDTDALLGAHFLIEDGPDNPLVNCLLMAAPSWGASRTEMREKIERNLVKGPRLTSRLMDTHYQGTQQVRLIAFAGTDFPAASDTIVLRNPDETEQYVRLIKVVRAQQDLAVTEGSTTALVKATIATCDLAEPLQRDFFGPPLQRTLNEAAYAQVFTTSAAGGAQFYGIKDLAEPVAVGASSLTVEGGIYSPLVPANRLERPLQDQYPLTQRQSLARTAQALLTLPAAVLVMAPGTVLRLPTAIEPGSLTITRGATEFTDDAQGGLRQGAANVGSVDYRARTITVSGGAPNYGSASTVVVYRPATPGGAAVHSDSLTITTGNQGRVFVLAMEPPPAPGTFALDFMSQERWYDLADAGSGKVAGADSSYGVGNVSYATGSASITLGSVPDVGSALIWSWGDTASAQAVDPAMLPARLYTDLAIDGRADPASIVLTWDRAGTDYTATVSAAGGVSGAATGRYTRGTLRLEPEVIPAGDVTVAYDRADQESYTFVNGGGGSYTLDQLPVRPGSVALLVPPIPQAAFDIPAMLTVTDDGDGQLLCRTIGAAGQVVGTVNYATGAVQLAESVAMSVYETVVASHPSGISTMYYETKELRTGHAVQLGRAFVTSMTHAGGATSAQVQVVTPGAWGLQVPVSTGLRLTTSALAFLCGGSLFTADAGVLKRGWNPATGVAEVESAGAVADSGAILVSAPPASGANAVTWINVAQDRSSPRVGQGVFRTANAPLKPGQFQIQSGALLGTASEAGVISGGGWSGSVDFQRGIVRWSRTYGLTDPFVSWLVWSGLSPVAADSLSYNAVYYQFMPLNADLLGMATARLPIDGLVDIFHSGGLVRVHHTETTVLDNPITQGVAYSLGRERIGRVRVTSAGEPVASDLYQMDYSAGDITFPVESDLTGLVQPFAVEHTIEDLLLCSEADLSGRLEFTRTITHDFPLGSKVSGVLPVGDLFARAFGFFDQNTWTGEWSDDRIGSDTTAEFNAVDYPVDVTNRGAVTERWALIFTSSTAFRIVGERYGQIGTGNVNALTNPINPATSVPFWSISPQSFGAGGWAAGNVVRFNTDACGEGVCVIRTILQGNDATNDAFSIALRGGVNA